MNLRFLPHKQSGLLKKILVWTAAGIVGLGLFGIIALAGLMVFLSIGLPDVTDLENLNEAQSTEIYDRDGNLLYVIHGSENREHVDLKDISQNLTEATVAIEDDQFWTHNGFDLPAIGKAVLYGVFKIGSPRGGSTITQQYIKNTFLSPERNAIRKAKELILAIRLERAYSKEKILELYLNRIPYGNNAHGIQKAAEIYFGKNAKDLDLAESAILASLPQAPSRYNPFGDNKYSHLIKEFTTEELTYRNIQSEYDLEPGIDYVKGLIGKTYELANGKSIYLTGRSDVVLAKMKELGKITEEEKIAALEKIQTIEFNKYREEMKAPHFVMEIKEQLEAKYGKDFVERGGLQVYTTIDPDLQEYAEKIAKEKGEYDEKTYGANNVAILTIDAKKGEILAMVGSRDYFNEEIDGANNVVMRPRQPGSSFKPIVYAQAFYHGYGPASVTYDIPMKIGDKRPQNYDGKWTGQISLRKALGQSRNIPAIQAYFLAGEQTEVIDLSEKMGITSLDKNHSYGYPLALGAGEISLYEMVRAYAVFANGGKKPEITGITRIINSNGDIIEEWTPKEFEEVMDPQIAYLINSILSDQEVGIGPRMYIPGKIVASKTGTPTKETKGTAGNLVRPSDGWIIGYTPSIVTGVWIGNTDGSGLGYNADGYTTAGPIFQAVMGEALKNMPAEPFPEPQGIQHIEVSKASGKLPGPNTPASMLTTEIFPSFSVPTEVENLFYTVKIDKISGLRATEFTPEDAIELVTYQNYEPIADKLNWKNEVHTYYSKTTDANGGIRVGVPPQEFDNVHTAQTESQKPAISITSPQAHSTLPLGSFTVNVALEAPNGVSKVEYFINDKLQHQTSKDPYTGYLNISKFLKPGSKVLIVAKVIDKMGYSASSAIEIKVEKTGESGTTIINTTESTQPGTQPTPETPPVTDGNTPTI